MMARFGVELSFYYLSVKIMVIHYLRLVCLALSTLACTQLAHADIYKWVDEQGQVHYSQQPPQDRPAEQMKTPAPPTIAPGAAREQIDELIESQQAAEQEKLKQQQQAEFEQEQQRIRQQNCEKAKHNLQQYRDNPGRRFRDAEGNVARLSEEQRQQRIEESQQRVDEYCQ